MSADKNQEQLDDLTQPMEELTTDQTANVRGGYPPTGTRSAVTATSNTQSLDTLLTSEVSVQKV